MEDYKYSVVDMLKETHKNFSVTRYEDGRMYIKSINPYDESNYHWAYSENGYNWNIYLGSPDVLKVALKTKNKKDIMRKMFRLDVGNNIKPKICHN